MHASPLTLAALCFALTTSVVQAQDESPAGAETTEPAVEAAEIPKEIDGEKKFEEGRDALFRGKYAEAIEALKAAVESDKDGTKTSYRLHLARAYRYARHPEKSETLLKEILMQSPDHVEAGQLLAEVYYSQEKWKAILDTLEPLLKYRHDYPTYHQLADAAYNLDDYDSSRKYYREAIKLNPKSGEDHYQLGNIYLAENRFALAAQSYESASGLGLESKVLHYKLASAYFNLRNYFGQIQEVTVRAGEAGTISGEWYLK